MKIPPWYKELKFVVGVKISHVGINAGKSPKNSFQKILTEKLV